MPAMSFDALRGEVEAQVELAVRDLREQLRTLQLEVADLRATQKAELQGAAAPQGDAAGAGGTAAAPFARELAVPASTETLPYIPLTVVGFGTNEPMGDQSEVVELPENLFAFCMGMLIVDPVNVCVPILGLFFLQWKQMFLLFSCLNGAMERLLKSHWTIAPTTVRQCISGDNTHWGVPSQDIAAALACMMLAACTMVADDRAVLASVYPNHRCPAHVRAVSIVCWCIQCLLIPQTTTVTISQLLCTSADGVDVVLNGLALTFIVEIDELLYQSIVPVSYRERLKLAFASGSPLWENCVKLPNPNQASVIAQRFGFIKFAVVTFLYLRFLHLASEFTGPRLHQSMFGVDDSGSLSGHVDMALCIVLVNLALPIAQSFAWAPDTENSSRVWHVVATLARGLVLSIFTSILNLFVTSLHSELLGWDVANFTWVSACFNRTGVD